MGERKAEQYGEAILQKIQSVTGGQRDTAENQNSGPEDEIPLTERRGKGRKEDFRLTKEILLGIQYTPRMTLSEFVSQVNELRDEKQMKRLTNKWLTERLLEEGCLKQQFHNGYARTVLTEKGRKAGIEPEERISEKGNPYEIFFYTEKAQRYLVELMKGGGKDFCQKKNM